MSNDQNKPVRVERDGLPEIDIQWFAEDQQGGDDDGNGDTGGDTGGSGEVDITSLPGWQTMFTEDVRRQHFDTLKDCEKPDTFFEKLNSISEKLKTAIVPPNESATDEEKSAYLKALGVPESKDGYELKQISKELAGQLGDIKDFNKWFVETAHSLDMTKAQTEMFYTKYLESIGDKAMTQEKAQDKLSAERTAVLQKEWGDKLDGNFELAKRAVKTFADEEFNSFLSDSGLAEDPRMIKIFYNIAQKIGGDSLESGSSSGNNSEMEPGQDLSYPSVREEFPVSEE